MASKVAKREMAKNAIVRTLTASKKSDFDLSDLESYLSLLKEQWSAYKMVHELVLDTCGAATIEQEESEYIQTEEYYRTALSNLNRALIRLPGIATPPNTPTDSSTSARIATPRSEIKLPRIEIPLFDGKIKDWIPFRDLFTSLIVNNISLAGSQKMHYLRNSVSGEALQLIKAFQITDGNFREAWSVLNKRYDVKRVIVDAHFSALFAIPKITIVTAASLRSVIDTTQEHLRALKVLDRPTDQWDDWLVHMTVQKLDPETHKQWELQLKDQEVPSFTTLSDFLELRCRSLEAIECHSQVTADNGKYPRSNQASKSKAATSSLHTSFNSPKQEKKSFGSRNNLANDQNCPNCAKSHSIYYCEAFKALGSNERELVRSQKQLCANCLSSGHSAEMCRSPHTCRVCQKRHHTLLHGVTATDALPSASGSSHHVGAFREVLLATAIIQVRDSAGRMQTARALLDSASHISFVTKECVHRLNLRTVPSPIMIEGIGTTHAGTTPGYVSLLIRSIDNLFSESIDAFVLPKITNNLPANEIKRTAWSHLSSLELADRHFYSPSAVDVLLGADVMGSLLAEGFVKGPVGTPCAQKTKLGWVIFGKVPKATVSQDSIPRISLNASVSLTDTIAKFWEMENIPDTRTLTKEEHECEAFFQTTHHRLPSGRFVVKLPFKPHAPFGSSRTIAVRSLTRMERRFSKDKELYDRYKIFIEEYINLGHMEKVEEPQSSSNCVYLPHHGVWKQTSTTTKLRVVFNASMPTSSGVSLNDTQIVGPQLQADLAETLLRFRTHKFAMTGDIAKMYRQVLVNKEDADFQRIVWRNTPTEEIEDFRLRTVTYGVASASYLAVRALQQCARDDQDNYPEAAETILNDFYMDDLLTGSYDENDLSKRRHDISTVLGGGCFEIRKWASNSAVTLQNIPLEHREIKHSLDIAEKETIRALGLQWIPSSDHLIFSGNTEPAPDRLTKRKLLSDASKLFDPLGLLSPTTISIKILFQKLWRPHVDWDDDVPEDIKIQWLKYKSSINKIDQICIPRWIGTGEPESILDLHGFADASQLAYAAVVYAKVISPRGNIDVRLITAKTRLAPLKTISLAQLELSAASLLAKLLVNVKKSIRCNIRTIHGWSDSTITLAWIGKCPSKCITFVANRVSSIQTSLPSASWHFVPSEHNPADCASRGISSEELASHPLWWTGPAWLRNQEEAWPIQPSEFTTNLGLRKQAITVLHTVPNPDDEPYILKSFSSFTKLKRVMAFILRFNYNSKTCNRLRKRNGFLSAIEINEALDRLLIITQAHYFNTDVSQLRNGGPISSTSNLLKLQPYLDNHGILRVGGRLRNAQITPDVRHPALLPPKSALTKLICKDIHRITLHAGPQAMQTMLQQRYWVVGARRLVRKITINCPICIRERHQQTSQLMADLPSVRVRPCRAFSRTGVDFAGPFQIRASKGRGIRFTKGYIAVFICMVTGAMHLELSSDLSSSTFIAAYKRFISRRGHCKELFSDNGTNFVGADKEMQRLLRQAMEDESTRNLLANDGTQWNFNPPSAPHMGGFWEAAVKRVKFHIKRTLKEPTLTFEEFYTLLVEIEACVNSRPLCPVTNDPDDLEVLTPGHFLIGESLKILPEPPLESQNLSLTQRWRLISQYRQHFWRRWSTEYLLQLQKRVKWNKTRPNLQVNDMVIIRDERLPPTKWRKGRIIKVHPGSDGIVRVVTVKTIDGELTRPVVKICPLNIEAD